MKIENYDTSVLQATFRILSLVRDREPLPGPLNNVYQKVNHELEERTMVSTLQGISAKDERSHLDEVRLANINKQFEGELK